MARGRPKKRSTNEPKVEVLPPVEAEVLDAEPVTSTQAEILGSESEVLPPVEVQAEEVTADVIDQDDSTVIDLEVLDSTDQSTASAALGIVKYDPLSTYLKEASRHPPLSREEERELAVRYFESRDRDAAYKLVVSNLWLVIKIAREYERAARNLLDLIQEGNIGLIEAVKNFDPYRGVRFPSYAVWWVKAYIIRYIIANWRLVKIGTTQAQRKLFFNLKKEREKLERDGFYPGPKLLAEKLNVKEDEVVEMQQRLAGADVSVDAPLLDDSEHNLHGLLPSSTPSAEESLGRREMRELILKCFDEFSETLNHKEQVIFKERMLGEDKATLQDISEKLSISRERVRQIENRLRERLKEFLAQRLGHEAASELEFE